LASTGVFYASLRKQPLNTWISCARQTTLFMSSLDKEIERLFVNYEG